MNGHDSFEPSNSQVDLTSFDDEFESAETPSYEEVPDGKYQVKIQTAKLESSQKGDPMIKFDLEIIQTRCRTFYRRLSSVVHSGDL
jgi:hypothetical protein